MSYDAVVVGSGPNGLSAAITLQEAGLSVLLIEGSNDIGGGLRTAELTLPGYAHDVCSAIHPLAAESPIFKSFPLQNFGLEFIYPPIAAAHPFDTGDAALLLPSLSKTMEALGRDSRNYSRLIKPLVEDWPYLAPTLLGPLDFPKYPLKMSRFGVNAIMPAYTLANLWFKTKEAKGLWAGMAAHSIQPLTNFATSAIGLVLMAVGHIKGWPITKGGSKAIAHSLAKYFESIGGKIETNMYIKSLGQLPESRAVLFDITPKQLLEIAGESFSYVYKWQLKRYKYGMGVFKVDWALKGEIPFTSPGCRSAATVHLGNTLEEIAQSEKVTYKGKHPEKPFVLLAQQTAFDTTRAPKGKHTAWAYCHVPNGSQVDMTEAIERQVERFAPGFRDLIIGRHTMNTSKMELYNPNYIGGDINGGRIDITQLFTRPALRLSPYRTSKKGLYICSSSTPPGGGVHGMCGYHAAERVLIDIFKIKAKPLGSFTTQLQ